MFSLSTMFSSHLAQQLIYMFKTDSIPNVRSVLDSVFLSPLLDRPTLSGFEYRTYTW
jgi:hypothetical protein